MQLTHNNGSNVLILKDGDQVEIVARSPYSSGHKMYIEGSVWEVRKGNFVHVLSGEKAMLNIKGDVQFGAKFDFVKPPNIEDYL